MKKLWFRKRTVDLAAVEARLAKSLTPVQPRPAYVQSLRARLMSEFGREQTEMQITSSLEERVPRGWLVAGGVMGGAVMLVLGVRGLLSLIGVLGLLLHRQEKDKSIPAISPAP